jgi:hypothetical protein
MPGTTFEDPETEVADPEGVLNGTPRAREGLPAPGNDKSDTDPPPAERAPRVAGRRRSALGRKSPQRKNQDAAAVAQGLQPGDVPAPMPEDTRDVRFWWPKILKEEFLDQGFAPSDARLYVYREKAMRRPGEKPTQLPPTIYGNQVEGHENQSAGDALVEMIILRYHPDARGPATYKVKCHNANPAKMGWIGIYGVLDLESPEELEQRRLRIEAIESKVRPAAPGAAAFGIPRFAAQTLPSASTAAPPAGLTVGAPTPVAAPGGMPDLMNTMMQTIFAEVMTAWREGRQPVMPPMPTMAPPAPKPEDEDARMAKQARMLVEALIVAGVVAPHGATQTASAGPPQDPVEAMYAEEVRNEKRDKIILGMARRRGMIAKDELPAVEVPAPRLDDDDDPDAKRREDESVVSHAMRQMIGGVAKEFAKDPGKMIGAILNSPVGNMLKDMVLKSGAGLPNVGTVSGMPSVPGTGGGFTPTT